MHCNLVKFQLGQIELMTENRKSINAKYFHFVMTGLHWDVEFSIPLLDQQLSSKLSKSYWFFFQTRERS